MYRFVRWASFVILSVGSYVVLAGICHALNSVVFRYLNHEFDQHLPQLAALLVLSLVFPFTAGSSLGRSPWMVAPQCRLWQCSARSAP